MTYQPFSLIMPEVPAYMSDGEIASLWGTIGYICSIQMEPYMRDIRRCNRVTIHFEHFGVDELREQITNGFYKTQSYSFASSSGVYRISTFGSLLLPCESSNPPRNEYSHIIAFQLQDIVRKQAEQIERLKSRFDIQLQDVVRKQAEQIQRLESRFDIQQQDIVRKQAEQIERLESRLDLHYQSTIRKQTEQIQRLESRIKEMETKIHEGTDLYMVAIEQFEERLLEQDAYCKYLEERIQDTTEVLNKHIEHSYRDNKTVDELKQETKALIDWCSRPIWNRTAAFNYEKEPECDFTSEF
jgi:hypothetical protein